MRVWLKYLIIGVLTTLDILLVGENEQQRILHFSVLDDPRQFALRLLDSVAVVGVDDEDQTLGTAEVVAPEGSDLVLSAYVPYVEFGVLVCHGLDVETHCWDCGYVLVEFELVENRWERISLLLAKDKGEARRKKKRSGSRAASSATKVGRSWI